jgi:hypothetical protein
VHLCSSPVGCRRVGEIEPGRKTHPSSGKATPRSRRATSAATVRPPPAESPASTTRDPSVPCASTHCTPTARPRSPRGTELPVQVDSAHSGRGRQHGSRDEAIRAVCQGGRDAITTAVKYTTLSGSRPRRLGWGGQRPAARTTTKPQSARWMRKGGGRNQRRQTIVFNEG